MKVFAVLVLFLACLVPAQADTWDVAASCQVPCASPANINAVFTTQLETGNFFDISFGLVLTGYTEPVVTNISGTFDGLAMTLVPIPELDWMNRSTPEDVSFMAGGVEYTLWWDGSYFIGSLPNPDFNEETLNWSAIDPIAPVPEPPMLWMLLAGLCLIACSCARNRQRSTEGIRL